MDIRIALLFWVLPFAAGFVIGGVYFLSMKVQVEYVVKKKGPEWLVPAAMYARMIFIALILVAIALAVPKQHVFPVIITGLAGVVVARVLVARMVKKGGDRDG